MTIPAHLLTNPLVNPPALPYGAPPFDLIRPEHIEPAIEWAIERQIADIDAIKNDPALPTFVNTSEALEFSGSDLSRIHNVVHVLFSSQTSDVLRAIQETVDEKVVQAGNEIWMDDVLFARLDAVHVARMTLGLDKEEMRLLEHQHKAFRETGVNLDPATKQRAKDIGERLSVLGNKFRENESNSLAAFEKLVDDVADLEGMPQKNLDKMAADATAAGHPGKWLVKIDPNPISILTFCSNRSLREEVFLSYNQVAAVAPYDNNPVGMEILKLSHELARIHGYTNSADHVVSDNMAKDTKTVNDFLDRALQVYKPAAEKYVDEVKAFALLRDGITDLQQWDMRYYSNIYKEKNCNFDSRDFEKYLNLDKVFDGLHQHLEKYFDIELRDETGKYPTYDPDVKVYEVHRQDGSGIVGLFYADYYARGKAKHSGAWMQEVRSRSSFQGVDTIPIVTNNCNYLKPGPGEPTLIDLDEYQTLYHEWGHALHGLLSLSKYASLAGTKVKTDWVEGPSQFQENFTLQKEVLDTFAVHQDTGQPIPQSLIDAANKFNYFDAGWMGLRQLSFCLLDMKSYDVDPATLSGLGDVDDAVEAAIGILPRVPGSRLTAFTHIFSGGYAAGYYSYKWAEVIDKHLFKATTQNGLYDPAARKLVTEHLYGSGNMVDPMDSFIAMTGTKPDPDILFAHEGLLPPPVQAAAPAVKPQMLVP